MIRFLLRRYYRRIGKLGGQARSEQLREPIRAKTRDLSFDEIANRMNVSNAQCCIYYRLIRERLGWQAQ